MPLEHILRAMQAQADSEIAQITRAAEIEIEQLIAEAETQAKAIRARHLARVTPMLASKTANIQNQAKLGALRALADAREQLLNDAFAQAEVRLAQIRASPQYASIFRALTHESIDALGNASTTSQDRNLIVRVDPQDTELARQVFAEAGVQCRIETQSMALGGLELTTHDGRVVVTNTLAVRLERARKLVRGPVAKILVDNPESNNEWMTSTVTPTPA